MNFYFQKFKTFLKMRVNNCIYNCTPHDVNVYDEEGKNLLITYPRNVNCILRVVSEESKNMGTFDVVVPLISVQRPCGFSDEHALFLKKADEERAALIVSMYTADAIKNLVPDFKGRLFTPSSSPSSAVRDEHGQIIGVRCFEVHK